MCSRLDCPDAWLDEDTGGFCYLQPRLPNGDRLVVQGRTRRDAQVAFIAFVLALAEVPQTRHLFERYGITVISSAPSEKR